MAGSNFHNYRDIIFVPDSSPRPWSHGKPFKLEIHVKYECKELHDCFDSSSLIYKWTSKNGQICYRSIWNMIACKKTTSTDVASPHVIEVTYLAESPFKPMTGCLGAPFGMFSRDPRRELDIRPATPTPGSGMGTVGGSNDNNPKGGTSEFWKLLRELLELLELDEAGGGDSELLQILRHWFENPSDPDVFRAALKALAEAISKKQRSPRIIELTILLARLADPHPLKYGDRDGIKIADLDLNEI